MNYLNCPVLLGFLCVNSEKESEIINSYKYYEYIDGPALYCMLIYKQLN